MASIKTNPTHVAKLGYSGFDMSNLLKFSSSVGELLPIYYDILQPGDKLSISTELRTRTMELESAAMCKIKEHVEYFFVPMNQLYSIFGDWYFGIQDLKSSQFRPESLSPSLPYVDAAHINAALASVQLAEDKYFGTQETNVAGTTPLMGTGLRLLELLGIPLNNFAKVGPDAQNTHEFMTGIAPILVAAYQKIYFDFYRLSDREPNDPSYYNLDRWYSTYNVNQDDLAANFVKMCTLRYRPWQRDFFTNLHVSPLMGALSTGSFSENHPSSILDLANSFRQWLSGTNLYTYNSSASPNQTEPTQVAPFSVSANQQIVSALSPASIRTSFAVEKLLEITRRAGKHYDAQTLAHFGVDVPTGIAGEVMYLGQQTSDINIGDVVATAGTDSDPLGKVGGKGYGYGDGESIKFTAPSHGIIMAIYSAEPVADYSVIQLDKLNTLMNRADWFTPEYDNLGMQPLFNYQVDYYGTTKNAIRGWQYRYAELKQKFNRVAGAMMRSLAYWSPQRNLAEDQDHYEVDPVSYYLINPSYLNDIMLKRYEFNAARWRDEDTIGDDADMQAGYQDIFDSDPLIHEFYIDCKKSSKMSTYGLASL